jgi:hypothetical protein
MEFIADVDARRVESVAVAAHGAMVPIKNPPQRIGPRVQLFVTAVDDPPRAPRAGMVIMQEQLQDVIHETHRLSLLG